MPVDGEESSQAAACHSSGIGSTERVEEVE